MKHFLIFMMAFLVSLPSFAAGIDSSTAVMLHMDGADAATSFTDDSGTSKAVTSIGQSQIDTAQAKFAQAGLMDGTGDGLSLADSNDFAFSNGTLDFWVRFNTVASTVMLYQQSDGTNAVYFQYYQPNNTLNFQIYTSAALTTFLAPTWTPATNTWYHIALVKNGSSYTASINGTIIGTATGGAWPNIAAPVYLGIDNAGTKSLNGWLDEYRISKSAIWTANFTPDTAAYSAPTPPPPPVVGVSEQAYWKDQAALQEPDAMVYVRAQGFDIVEDHPLYLLNGWRLSFSGGANTLYFHRPSAIDNATMLPAGTHIRSTNTVWPYAYYADPELVTDDPRYENARDLYYQRLEKLKGLTLHTLTAYIPQGYTVQQYVNDLAYDVEHGTNTAAPLSVPFPTDFENGLIVGHSIMDGSWAVIETPDGIAPGIPRILNLHDEINDVQSFRGSDGKSFVPFKRSNFSRLTIGFGSVAWGNCSALGVPHIYCQADGIANDIVPIYPGAATFNQQAVILYYKLDDLPGPW